MRINPGALNKDQDGGPPVTEPWMILTKDAQRNSFRRYHDPWNDRPTGTGIHTIPRLFMGSGCLPHGEWVPFNPELVD